MLEFKGINKRVSLSTDYDPSLQLLQRFLAGGNKKTTFAYYEQLTCLSTLPMHQIDIIF